MYYECVWNLVLFGLLAAKALMPKTLPSCSPLDRLHTCTKHSGVRVDLLSLPFHAHAWAENQFHDGSGGGQSLVLPDHRTGKHACMHACKEGLYNHLAWQGTCSEGNSLPFLTSLHHVKKDSGNG